MTFRTLDLGKRGEIAAVNFLAKNGYKIAACNFKTRFGEIDIVAKEGRTICFIEIKTRGSLALGFPEEAVTARKQWRLNRLARGYLQRYRLEDVPVRFDVVSVLYGQDGEVARIRLIKGAFGENGL